MNALTTNSIIESLELVTTYSGWDYHLEHVLIIMSYRSTCIDFTAIKKEAFDDQSDLSFSNKQII